MLPQILRRSYKATVASKSPALAWALGPVDRATDFSGNGRNGTGWLVGAQPGPPAMYGSSGATIENAYDPFSNTQVRTFIGWSYRPTGAGTDNLIIGNTGAGNAARPQLAILTGTNDVRWLTRITDTGATSNATWTNAWPGFDRWVLWGLYYSPTADTATLYINGSAVSTVTGLTQTFTGTNLYKLQPQVVSNAHVAVFERELIAAEHLALYRAGSRTARVTALA